MREQDAGFDFHRYRRLLAEAVDENKRLAFIDLLIEERAKDRLEAQRSAERMATTIAQVLRPSRPDLADIVRSLRAAGASSAPAIARRVVSR